MSKLSNLWGREPVLILGVVQAALALAVSFGLELSGEQTGAVMAFSAAVLSLIARRTVTSPAGASQLIHPSNTP